MCCFYLLCKFHCSKIKHKQQHFAVLKIKQVSQFRFSPDFKSDYKGGGRGVGGRGQTDPGRTIEFKVARGNLSFSLTPTFSTFTHFASICCRSLRLENVIVVFRNFLHNAVFSYCRLKLDKTF